ncbi:MAG: metallophosphoesterase [Clostridia bacterium]|nr:metallophosphoesterase [Clostridia bacterium]
MLKKIFVVSDPHGHCTLLENALNKAGFDNENKDHLLVCCGDYFDRGNENAQVLKFFERVKNKVLLRGNHEDLLLKLLQTGKVLPHNYINGTMITLENFFGKYFLDPVTDTIDFSGKTSTVNRICSFLEDTVNYFETENYVFVHGWLPPKENCENDLKSVSDELWEKARWIKWTDAYSGQKPLRNKTLVCGHMPTFFAKKFDANRKENDADIFYGNGLIAIDAGTADTKTVNVLVIEDNLI